MGHWGVLISIDVLHNKCAAKHSQYKVSLFIKRTSPAEWPLFIAFAYVSCMGPSLPWTMRVGILLISIIFYIRRCTAKHSWYEIRICDWCVHIVCFAIPIQLNGPVYSLLWNPRKEQLICGRDGYVGVLQTTGKSLLIIACAYILFVAT